MRTAIIKCRTCLRIVASCWMGGTVTVRPKNMIAEQTQGATLIPKGFCQMMESIHMGIQVAQCGCYDYDRCKCKAQS